MSWKISSRVIRSSSPALFTTFHTPGRLLQLARRAHPVQRLVRTVVGVDGHRAVRLDHQQAHRERQMRGETADIVHGALRDDQTHPTRVAVDADATSRSVDVHRRCDAEIVLEVLTGTGLAASAGLECLHPPAHHGSARPVHRPIDLPSGWQWLSNGWVLVILAVLLAIEVVADKVPVVDHVNDVVQTVVRPTAGGLAFGAGSSSRDGDGDRPGLVLLVAPVGADRGRRDHRARACTG